MNGANIWAIPGGSSAGLTAKALYGLMVARERIRREFKRDGPAELEVLSLVDHTHTAATKFFSNAIVGDGPADERVRA